MSLKSKKLRNSAEGQECQIRVPGYCNGNTETTILAHVGKGGGVGQKCDDIHATFACSACHDVIDGRTKTVIPMVELGLYAWEGVQRTQAIWLEQELLKVA